MPDGFLWQKKKMSTDFDIRHYNPESFCAHCFIEQQCSFEWDTDRPRASGHSYQGTPPPDPDCPVRVWNCRLKNPHEIKTLAVKSSKLIFLGYERGQEARREDTL